MGKVSIIMPLFNAEKYLQEALQSVLKQTYGDFELICVDDCSTDGTKEILAAFQNLDTRIKILTNDSHSGAAPSRNKGLREAQGEYVVFLDGDDIFEEEMLEKAYGAMEKYDIDLVIYEYMHIPSDDIYTKRVKERSSTYIENFCRTPFSVGDFQPEEFPTWSSSPCDKMFRRSFLNENKLEFQDLPSSNDIYFGKMAIFCARKMICLDDRRIMVYARDHFETSRISSDRDSIYAYYAMEKLTRELKERNMLDGFAKFLYHILPLQLIGALKADQSENRRKKTYTFLQTEGISKCIEYGKENCGQIDSYDLYLLDSFQNKTYESGWFYSPDTYFQVYLRKNGERTICPFVREKLLQNKNIILWGVGKNGTYLLNYLKERFIEISAVVDSDESKQGMIVSGYKVLKPNCVWEKADYILTTSAEVCKAVKNVTKDTKTILVNVYDMVTKGGDGL